MRTMKPIGQQVREAKGLLDELAGGKRAGERPVTLRPEFPANGLIEGKVSASYGLKVGRPSYSSEEIALSVSFPVFGEGPEGLEAKIAEAHAGAVRALEARVHDLFAEIEARRAAEARR